MGNNNRFKLSNMLPNAWFYKLKDMSKSSKGHTTQNPKKRSHLPIRASTTPTPTPKPIPPPQFHVYLPNRASHYFPTNQRPEKPPSFPSHLKASDTRFPDSPPKKAKKTRRPKLDLPPILTKPQKSPPRRRIIQGGHRIRLRASSPRLMNKRVEANHRTKTTKIELEEKKCLRDSYVIMKPSSNPQREFRESMVEMIMENDIRSAREFEELLACYLSLNSDEYHDMIVKVFKQIWFEFVSIRTC